MSAVYHSLLFCLLYIVCVVVLFFKQKTAYEMRISDWSSDVCSSDLFQLRPLMRVARILDGKLVQAEAPLQALQQGIVRLVQADPQELPRPSFEVVELVDLEIGHATPALIGGAGDHHAHGRPSFPVPPPAPASLPRAQRTPPRGPA